MQFIEFVKVMACVSAATDKPLSADAAQVYFDLLGDLPLEVLQTAAKRVLLEHKWATFPSIAEFRQAAVETIDGEVAELSPAEAWQLAWDAAGKIDLEMKSIYRAAGKDWPTQAAYELSKVPGVVVEAMKAYGLPALVYGEEPVGVVRSQFIKIFEQLQHHHRRLSLMPKSLQDSIARLGCVPEIHQAVAEIGLIPP